MCTFNVPACKVGPCQHDRTDEKRVGENKQQGNGGRTADEWNDGRCLRREDIGAEAGKLHRDPHTDECRSRCKQADNRGIARLQGLFHRLAAEFGRQLFNLRPHPLDQFRLVAGCEGAVLRGLGNRACNELSLRDHNRAEIWIALGKQGRQALPCRSGQ